METIIRFFEAPRQSFFLFGPRGTGKSTWLRSHAPHALWIDLLEADTFRAYSSRPERLRELLLANPDSRIAVIDEIPKVPDLLSVVHGLIEEKRRVQFILTGSSARKLKRTGVDLLAGRALNRSMHPFMAAELGHAFRLQQALTVGLLPLVVASDRPQEVAQSYAGLYLREEVQMEGLVRKIGNFSRFLEAVSFSHAAPLNISNVARDCETERKTVEGYVEILEDLLLAYRIPIFTRRARRAVSVHPKFFFFDAGVFQSLRPRGPLDRPEEIGGAALEGLVAQHLLAWNSYRGGRNTLYYWRTRSGLEVDFVLYGPDCFWAIEIKNTARVRPEDVRALQAFREDYPTCKAVMLTRGKERILTHGILCAPVEDFLKRLHPGKNLDAILRA